MAYADVASAVSWWVVTNSIRNQLVNSLLELVGLKYTTNGNKEYDKAERKKTNMIWKILSHCSDQRQPTNVFYLTLKQESKYQNQVKISCLMLSN